MHAFLRFLVPAATLALGTKDNRTRRVFCSAAAGSFLALAAVSAKAWLEPGDLIYENCTNYAQGAVDANTLNKENSCGFTDARFTASFERHLFWCESHSKDEVESEVGKRTRQINSCTICRAHARAAVGQLKAMKALQCKIDIKGAMHRTFSPAEDLHFHTCYGLISQAYGEDWGNGNRTVQKLHDERETALNRCVDRSKSDISKHKDFCHSYAFGNSETGVVGVRQQVENNKCAPPPDPAGRWSRDLYLHFSTCLRIWDHQFNIPDLGAFFTGERAAREADLKEQARLTDCDEVPGQTKQPLTVAPKITDPEGDNLIVRRGDPARITDPEGKALTVRPAAVPPTIPNPRVDGPSLKTGKATGGPDGSKDNDQTKKKLTVRPATTPPPKATGGRDGSGDGCNSAMDRLGGGCVPKAASGGGSTFTPRDANRPPASAGGTGAAVVGGGAPAAKPAPSSNTNTNTNTDFGMCPTCGKPAPQPFKPGLH